MIHGLSRVNRPNEGIIVANESSLQNTSSLSAEAISIRMGNAVLYLSGGLLMCISLVDYHFLKTGVSSLSESSQVVPVRVKIFP